jgi:hypothetical protein
MPTTFIAHRGIPLIHMDFHGVTDKGQGLAEVAAAQQFVAAQPKRRSLRVLADVKDAKWDGEILEAIRKMMLHNRPWVLASAVVGVNTFARVTIRALLLLSGRKIAMMSNEDSAKDWLIRQTAPPEQVPDEA